MGHDSWPRSIAARRILQNASSCFRLRMTSSVPSKAVANRFAMTLSPMNESSFARRPLPPRAVSNSVRNVGTLMSFRDPLAALLWTNGTRWLAWLQLSSGDSGAFAMPARNTCVIFILLRCAAQTIRAGHVLYPFADNLFGFLLGFLLRPRRPQTCHRDDRGCRSPSCD